MKRFFKTSAFIFAALSSLFLTGCNSDINLTLNKNDSVNIELKGKIGKGFSSLIQAAGGDEASFIDKKEMEKSLKEAGFTDIKISTDSTSSLNLQMTAPKDKTWLFKSGIVSSKEGKLSVSLKKEQLQQLYKQSDEETVMLLDLLMAPVFNEEESTEEEYTDFISTVYGNAAAKELSEAQITLKIKNSDNTIQTQTISFTKLLCGLY